MVHYCGILLNTMVHRQRTPRNKIFGDIDPYSTSPSILFRISNYSYCVAFLENALNDLKIRAK